MNTIPIASFNDLEKAEKLKQCLEKGGIRAELQDESRLHKYLFWAEPLAAHKVEVEEKDFNKARAYLEQQELSQDLLRFAVRCPQCHSPRIDYPQFYTRKFNLPALVDIAATKTGLVGKYFYCEECHFTWPKVEPVERDRDILNWPKDRKGLLPY